MDAFERLVTVNRYNSPEPIAAVFSLERAIDQKWCEETSRALMGDRKWEILEASPSLSEHLPDKAGLYMFVWRIPFPFPTNRIGNHNFRLVGYVGQAGGGDSVNTIRQRYKQEYAAVIHAEPQSLWNHDTPDRVSRLSRFLNLPTLEFWFHAYGERDLIKTFEDALIKLLNPPVNSQLAERNPAALRGNVGRAIPAF